AVDDAGARRAAVAIVVTPHEGSHAYLLTRRAAGLRRNAGMYALPGGRLESGEDAIDAAVRETAEELGVSLERAGALGLSVDFAALPGWGVPRVVWGAEGRRVLNPAPAGGGSACSAPLDDLHPPEAPQREAHPDGGPPILRMYMKGRWMNPP